MGRKQMTLVEWIVDKKISKRDLSIDLGINESTLYNYIRGTREPTLSVAIKIVHLSKKRVTFGELSINPIMIKNKPILNKKVDTTDLF